MSTPLRAAVFFHLQPRELSALRPNPGLAPRVLKVLPAAFADSGPTFRFGDELRRAASVRDNMVFYRLVTRRLPFAVSSNDPLAWREAHLHQPVLPPHQVNAALPPRLSRMVLQMTAKDPAARPRDWQTVWELLSDGTADSPLNQLIHDTRRNRVEMNPDEVASAPQREAEQERRRQIAVADAPRRAAEAARKNQADAKEADPFFAQAMQTIIRPLQDWAEAGNRGSTGGQTIRTDTKRVPPWSIPWCFPTARRARLTLRFYSPMTIESGPLRGQTLSPCFRSRATLNHGHRGATPPGRRKSCGWHPREGFRLTPRPTRPRRRI